MRQDGLAGSCVLPDEQSFSSGDGDTRSQSCGGDALVLEHLHGAVQPAHKLVGHLFSGRYKSLIVNGSGSGYLRSVCDYVHLNPVRAKMVPAEQKLRDFAWISWPEYLRPPEQRPCWLRVDRLLGELGIPKDSIAGRDELEKHLEWRRAQEDGDELKKIRRGWCLGGETFRKELLEQAHKQAGDIRVAQLKIETGGQNEFKLE